MADDFANNTATTGTVAAGGQTTGTLETSGDEDWFKVTLVAGTSYVFDLLGANGGGGTLGNGSLNDPYLSLYDTRGLFINASARGGTGGDPLMTYVPTASGTYYLGVDELFGKGTGTYTVRVSGTAIVDDYAATTSTTGTVAVGGQTTGTLEVGGDKDWFKVTLTAGTTYVFDLRGANGGGGTLGNGSLNDPYLSLYDTRGLYVKATASGGTGGDPLMTYTPTTSGTYYVGVDELFAKGTGTYTLRASVSTIVDDYAETTSTSGTVAVGGQSTGSIEVAGDRDWFKVTLTAGTTYVFDLRGANGGGGTLGNGSLNDPYLSLYDTRGLYINATASGGTGGDPTMTYTPTASGTYYLGVDELFRTGTGTYTVRAQATTGSATPTSSDDYSNNISTSGRISVGATLQGRIETAGDSDWFAATLTAGTTYKINLDTAATSGLPDPFLRVYNSAGSAITSDDDSGTGLNAELSYTPATSGTYYFGASSSYGTDTGLYNLTLSATSAASDDFAAAVTTQGRVSIGGSTSGRIEVAGDSDWFAATLTAGTSYKINLDASASSGLSDPYLRLYSSSGSLIASDDDSGLGLNSQLSYTPSTTATYYFEARSSSFVSSATGGYTLILSAVAATAADDFAATSSTTGRANIGGTIAGRIETTGDHDWFAVTLTAGTAYKINLDAAASSGLRDPYLRIYNGSGTQISSDDDSGSGLNAQLSFTPTTTGTYYLGAASSTYASSATGAYNLTVAAPQIVGSSNNASRFNIDIQYTGAAQYRVAFEHAVARWESIITGDLPSVTNARYGSIDDLLIVANISAIDGVGGTLGQAAPTGLRGSGLPYLGVMEFDSADVARMFSDGTLETAILHEMGHVLGLGTLWEEFGLKSSSSTYQYIGASAVGGWRVVSNNSAASYVPLESEGGAGTAGSHWSETILGDEIMTGYLDAGAPISLVTIGSLGDLGYVVDYSRADRFFIV